jgi:chemotaxis protein methyltransferase CheR
VEVSPPAMRAFAALLHDRTGQEIGAGRSWRIETALSPLLKAHGIDSLDRLACVMTRDADLAAGVVDALLNNETSFFRDRAAFTTLFGGVLESIAARGTGRRLSIWCAGCSTGQEVYSIAMLLGGEPERWAGWTIDLLGSDVSGAAITRARAGVYSHFEVQRGLPMGEMLRWFDPIDEEWRVRQELRTRVRFVTHNLLDRPPTGVRADVILCRNVLLYLVAAKRAQVFDRLAAALAPDGLLMLGAGETVLGQSRAFEPDPLLRGFYRRADWKGGPMAPHVERRAAG